MDSFNILAVSFYILEVVEYIIGNLVLEGREMPSGTRPQDMTVR
jgi:hypothetical protein